ncbi:hypothetical protein B0H11DRAFT_2090679 [Mycena galericulata]|nr:hypothetical protein B0H11DRAFT_2090679 [Mycena galericulata]
MRRAPPQSSQCSTTPGARAHAQAAAPAPRQFSRRGTTPPTTFSRSTCEHTHALHPAAVAATAPSVILPAAAPCRAAFPATTRPVISPCTAEHITADRPLLVRAYASILDVHSAARPQRHRGSHWMQRIRHGTERPSVPRTGRRGDGCACRTVCRNGQCGPQTTALYAPPPPFPLPLRLTAWSSPSEDSLIWLE